MTEQEANKNKVLGVWDDNGIFCIYTTIDIHMFFYPSPDELSAVSASSTQLALAR